jgi:hypothetical protein
MVGEPDAAALPGQPVRPPEASVGAASAATGPLDAVGAARAPVAAFPGGPEAGGDPGSDQATGETSEAAMDVGEEAAEADEGAAAAENSLLQCGSKRARICACIWKVCRRPVLIAILFFQPDLFCHALLCSLIPSEALRFLAFDVFVAASPRPPSRGCAMAFFCTCLIA